VLLLAHVFDRDFARMTRWSAITRTRGRRSALAYGSHSTTAAEDNLNRLVHHEPGRYSLMERDLQDDFKAAIDRSSRILVFEPDRCERRCQMRVFDDACHTPVGDRHDRGVATDEIRASR